MPAAVAVVVVQHLVELRPVVVLVLMAVGMLLAWDDLVSVLVV